MRTIHVAAIGLGMAVQTLGAQAPVSETFFSAVTLGDNVLDVKIADAVRRIDGRWLTFGSRTTSGPGGRDTAVLVLRDTDGAPLDVRELTIDGPWSYRPMAMAALGGSGDAVVLGVEYDTGGNRSVSLTRVNAALDVVWSTRLASPAGVFEWARLVARRDEEVVLIGEFRRFVAGGLDNGDAVLATVSQDGTVSDIRPSLRSRSHEAPSHRRDAANPGTGSRR